MKNISLWIITQFFYLLTYQRLKFSGISLYRLKYAITPIIAVNQALYHKMEIEKVLFLFFRDVQIEMPPSPYS